MDFATKFCREIIDFATPIYYRGKTYTTCEATQKQRQMETALRAQREKVKLLKEAGADKADITEVQCRYQARLDAYKSFSKTMKLPEQTNRIYTGRTAGRIAPNAKTYAKWWESNQSNKNVFESRLPESEGIFNTLNFDSKDVIKPRNIIKNLSKSSAGKRALDYLNATNTEVKLCYGVDRPIEPNGHVVQGVYDPVDDVIKIYVDVTKSVEVTAETIVHEATHKRLNVGGDQYSEFLCFREEMHHKLGREWLTEEEERNIINRVKKAYPEFKWKRDG